MKRCDGSNVWRAGLAVLGSSIVLLSTALATTGEGNATVEQGNAPAQVDTPKGQSPVAEESPDIATLEETVEASERRVQAAAAAQATIERLSDDSDRLATEYRRTLQETESLRAYNDQLKDLLVSQQSELASLRRQIDDVSVVGRQITPRLLKMIDTIEAFVELDVPFLLEERRGRVTELRALMHRSDVSLSEKYRRVVEAYQVENEFGRTIESYRTTLDIDGVSRTLDFLRVGRISLLYQTLDGKETGAWSPEKKAWTPVSDDYRGSVRQGLRIASKQVAPDLIRVPVSAPQEAK
jgi:hypothetical protein